MTLLLICLRSTENERLSLNESLEQEETDEHADILESGHQERLGWGLGQDEEKKCWSSLVYNHDFE